MHIYKTKLFLILIQTELKFFFFEGLHIDPGQAQICPRTLCIYRIIENLNSTLGNRKVIIVLCGHLKPLSLSISGTVGYYKLVKLINQEHY